MSIAGGSVEVRRLRVRSPDRDTLSARLRVERLVAHADLHPPDLEERAILCVRRLRPTAAQGFSPEAFRGWELHANELLGRIARRAGRPALGPSPGDAEAVLFRDRAEMLACLASDWARGIADSRWWWKVLLRESPGPARVVAAFLAHAEFVPAAVERLARAGELPGFLQRIEAAQAREIRHAVALKFGVAHTVEVWEAAAATVAAVVVETRTGAMPNLACALQIAVAADTVPWREFAHEFAAARVEEWQRTCFAAVALMVARAPAVLASNLFRAELRAWSAAVAQIAALESPLDSISPAAPPTPEDERLATVPRATETPSISPAPPIQHAEPHTRDPHLSPSVEEKSPPQFARQLPPHLSIDQRATAPMETPAPAIETSRPPASRATRFEAPPSERTVITAFGGLLYLVNAGLSLGFYNDFTRPADPGIDLPLWDYVALIGHSLIGRAVGDDAIWPLLAELAGRDHHTAPGADFNAEWLDGLITQTRQRLTQAIGDTLLCPAHARLVLTETRLNAHFRLHELPIEVRFAGLDRDPGWLPSARCDIRFHYL